MYYGRNNVVPLKACKHKRKRNKPSVVESNTGLSQRLPDEVTLSILSFFTIKEVARLSVLSRKWKDLWKHLWKESRILIFEDPKSMDKIRDNYGVLREERSRFIKWVTHVVEEHSGLVIDEFKVTFDLESCNRFHIDKWVALALAKDVKKFVLDFERASHFYQVNDYNFSLKRLGLLCNLSGKLALTSLCLKHVLITTEDLQWLLHSCSHLENLCIEWSVLLPKIVVSDSLLGLKYLEVSNCPRMKAIDICAPKLVSFRYKGFPIELNIRNADSLVELCIAGFKDVLVSYAFDSLWKYFSQLEYVKLDMWLLNKVNLEINNCPALTNLKHLELTVIASWEHTLLGWVPLIESSPVLQTLTVKLYCLGTSSPVRIAKRDGRPLQCLKTLELVGFVGCRLDTELAIHVCEKAVTLEKVIVDVTPCIGKKTRDSALERAMALSRLIPCGAKFILHQ